MWFLVIVFVDRCLKTLTVLENIVFGVCLAQTLRNRLALLLNPHPQKYATPKWFVDNESVFVHLTEM